MNVVSSVRIIPIGTPNSHLTEYVDKIVDVLKENNLDCTTHRTATEISNSQCTDIMVAVEDAISRIFSEYDDVNRIFCSITLDCKKT